METPSQTPKASLEKSWKSGQPFTTKRSSPRKADKLSCSRFQPPANVVLHLGILNSSPTATQLGEALLAMSPQILAGHENWRIAELVCLPAIFWTRLSQIFALVVAGASCPAALTCARTTMLPKPHAEAEDDVDLSATPETAALKLRHISVTSVLLRLLSTCIAQNLTFHAERTNRRSMWLQTGTLP
jgi:hypothetical protein